MSSSVPPPTPPGGVSVSAAAKIAREEMAKHGLGPDWSYGVDRALRRLGCCHGQQKRITLSRHFLRCVGTSPDNVRQVVLHEIAHALVGCEHKHDDVWRACALALGCSSTTACAKVPFKVAATKARYVMWCRCGNTCMRRHRLRKGCQNAWSRTLRRCPSCKVLLSQQRGTSTNAVASDGMKMDARTPEHKDVVPDTLSR